MKKFLKLALGFALLPLFWCSFAGTFIVCHPLIWLADRLGGYAAYRQALLFMNHLVLFSLRLVGSRFVINGVLTEEIIKKKHPIIVVSNHQSMFDIPLIIVSLAKLEPRFISKIELAKGIPGISIALRKMRAALIDRSDRLSALKAIAEFAHDINRTNGCAVIFPEGTRAKKGVIKPFKLGGLEILLKNIPTAKILPITINGSWRLNRYNLCPLPFGELITLTIGKAIDVDSQNVVHQCLEVEKIINQMLLTSSTVTSLKLEE